MPKLDKYGSDAGSEDVAVIYGMVINAPGIEVVTECPADWDSPEDEIYDETEEEDDAKDKELCFSNPASMEARHEDTLPMQ